MRNASRGLSVLSISKPSFWSPKPGSVWGETYEWQRKSNGSISQSPDACLFYISLELELEPLFAWHCQSLPWHKKFSGLSFLLVRSWNSCKEILGSDFRGRGIRCVCVILLPDSSDCWGNSGMNPCNDCKIPCLSPGTSHLCLHALQNVCKDQLQI